MTTTDHAPGATTIITVVTATTIGGSTTPTTCRTHRNDYSNRCCNQQRFNSIIPGPTTRSTSAINTGATTVTAPGLISTVTATETETVIEVINSQVVTDIETITNTATIISTETATATITSYPTDGSTNCGGRVGGLDYGTCSDPTIR
ncbi:hypothetical protein ETB97_003726 [Aspergillus alliaceus]|uniref:Uncharacterized protein n=1 Tax=Petromyces alliaceus TaxID=209559 RepID=A0A8H6AG44_PETAA|nr:hypothetical protein ETB97_003726 [Aspergillus burnettii]